MVKNLLRISILIFFIMMSGTKINATIVVHVSPIEFRKILTGPNVVIQSPDLGGRTKYQTFKYGQLFVTYPSIPLTFNPEITVISAQSIDVDGHKLKE